MTTIYLIRHAHAEGNLYRRVHGHYNSLLTEQGRRQVSALTQRFQGEGVDAVYSSPLTRCLDTAQAVAGPKGLPILPEPGLMELGVGRWEDVSFGQIQTHEPELCALFAGASPMFQIEGGETFGGVAERMESAVRRIAAAHPGQRVACVSHAMAIRALLSRLHGWGVEGIGGIRMSDNTAVSCLEVEEEEIRIVYEADASHLPGELSTVIKKKAPGQEHLAFAFGNRNLWYRNWDPDTEKALYLSCRREAWVDIHGPSEPFHGEEFYQAARQCSQADPRSVAVAYLGSEMVGMVQCDLDRDAGEGICFVPFVYMNPQFRHQGLGVQLIGQAVSLARPLGRSRLRLRCAPTNAVAKRFYSRYGFRKAGMAADSRVELELLEKDIGYPHAGV
jgi:probable phosphoglycerate mutase